MRVRFLDQARVDLVAHNEHYREIGGALLACRMLTRIRESVLTLSTNPEITSHYELAPGIRRLVVARGTLLVFYRIRADVEVLHIRRVELEPVTENTLGRTTTLGSSFAEALVSMPDIGMDSDFMRHAGKSFVE